MTVANFAEAFFYGNNDEANEMHIAIQLADQQMEFAEEEDDDDDSILASLVVGFFQPNDDEINDALSDLDEDEDEISEGQAMATAFYLLNHSSQTYQFAKGKKEEYERLNRGLMSIWQCCEVMKEIDYDDEFHQMQHLLQTAEAIRKDYPDQDWLRLTALIHDLGKVLMHPSFGGLPLWFVVGDTFPVGCAFHESIIYHEFFKENPDLNNPKFNTKLGIYTPNCGLDRVTMSWGHDEYMYLVAKGNDTTLPPEALFIIRFHSFFSMREEGAYTYLLNEDDKEMLKWVQIFSKYDVYDGREKVSVEDVKPYYISLIHKYFPASDQLRW